MQANSRFGSKSRGSPKRLCQQDEMAERAITTNKTTRQVKGVRERNNEM